LERAFAVASDLKHFRDPAGGYFQSPDDGEDLGVRRKEAYDGALPSGNSVAAWCLYRLSDLTGDVRWRDEADRTLRAFSGSVARAPQAFAMMCVALDHSLGPTKELVVVGEGPEAERMLDVARTGYRPELVVLRKVKGLDKVAPWTAAHDAKGKAAAFLCEAFACKAPVTTPGELARLLGP
jgi:uncharacterized protein YyaL (SSP411 family)